MKTVHISASKCYDVLIGTDLLCDAGNYIRNFRQNCKVAIISDSNVWPIYGQKIKEHLCSAGFEVFSFVFPAGEANKNGSTYLSILNFLAESKLTRTDLLVALGGGVVGDITGFAAATYLRGIAYVQIPTTLLSMVDSSVGGKTAIDLPAGKNLCGAFYQPMLVLCDITTLRTLPQDVFSDGCAEVIKYGILYDPVLFSHLEENGIGFNREYVISRCVELKRDVVACDEFDTGARQKLNLGHTIGHGIEGCSNFEISHGQAVAAGMAIVSRASQALGICSQALVSRILSVLDRFSLPTNTAFTASQLYQCALSDKKRAGQTINLIVPQLIGTCIIHPIPTNKLKSFIEAGLE